MSQEEKTLTELFCEFADDDASGRDHTLLLNAVEDIERDRLAHLRVSPFTDKGSVRFVRFRIFGLIEETPVVAGCFVSDIASEEEASLAAMDEMIGTLPAGMPAGPGTIAAVLASGIRTIVAAVLFKNDRDEWVRYVYHHPGLTRNEALSAARSFSFEAEIDERAS